MQDTHSALPIIIIIIIIIRIIDLHKYYVNKAQNAPTAAAETRMQNLYTRAAND